MPIAPKPACRRPGCPALSNGSGFCKEHAELQGRVDYSFKGSRRDRGYPPGWEKLRLRILARDPLCRAMCGALSSEADHIRPLERGGSNRDDNLQGLCKSCHSRKTVLEQRLLDPVAVMASLTAKVAYNAPNGVGGVKSCDHAPFRTVPPPRKHDREIGQGGVSGKNSTPEAR